MIPSLSLSFASLFRILIYVPCFSITRVDSLFSSDRRIWKGCTIDPWILVNERNVEDYSISGIWGAEEDGRDTWRRRRRRWATTTAAAEAGVVHGRRPWPPSSTPARSQSGRYVPFLIPLDTHPRQSYLALPNFPAPTSIYPSLDATRRRFSDQPELFLPSNLPRFQG